MKLHRLIIFALALESLVFAGCADHEGEARQAMERAAQEVATGRKLEATSWNEALRHYDAALLMVATVNERYPDTAAGALASKPGTFLGPVPLGTLQSVILPAVRRRAEAEAGAWPCAAFIAAGIHAPTARVAASTAVLRLAAKAHETGVSEGLLAVATGAAEALPVGTDAQEVAWEAVAEAQIALRNLDAAKELVLAHGLSDAWQHLAIAYTQAGQSQRAQAMAGHAISGRALAKLEARLAIATALFKAGDPLNAAPFQREAERWVKDVALGDRPHAALLMAQHLAAQGQLAQAEVWLGSADCLHVASPDELDATLIVYRDARAEDRLRTRIRTDLALIEAGTKLGVAHETRWLANLAYLQAKLGEPEPAAFALSRARIQAESVRELNQRAALLLGIAVRQLTIGQEAGARDTDRAARAVLLELQSRELEASDRAGTAPRLPTPKAAGDETPTGWFSDDRVPGLQTGLSTDRLLAEAARLGAHLREPDQALALVAAIESPPAVAIALAQCAAAAPGGLIAPEEALHALLKRFDPGAPGLNHETNQP